MTTDCHRNRETELVRLRQTISHFARLDKTLLGTPHLKRLRRREMLLKNLVERPPNITDNLDRLRILNALRYDISIANGMNDQAHVRSLRRQAKKLESLDPYLRKRKNQCQQKPSN